MLGGLLAAAELAAAVAEPTQLHVQRFNAVLFRVDTPNGSVILRMTPEGPVAVSSAERGWVERAAFEAQRSMQAPALPIRAWVLPDLAEKRPEAVPSAWDSQTTLVMQRRIAEKQPSSQSGESVHLRQSVVVFDNDYEFHVGHTTIGVEFIGHGRTGADSVVLFKDLRTLVVGDLYVETQPRPDCTAGGSYAGWAAAIDHLLWLDFDVAIPYRGAPVGRSKLTAFRDLLLKLAATTAVTGTGRAACNTPG